MESIKRPRWLEGFMSSKPKQTEPKKEQKPPEVTSIEFYKRKRDQVDDEFETALTNGRSTIFETKSQRETRKTFNIPTRNGADTDINRFVAGHYGLADARTKQEASKNINNRIRSQYQKKIADIEHLGKTSQALESIMPKIESLIENDEGSTNLANKLYSDQYNSSRRNTGYVCSPLLSIFSREVIPEKLQKDIQYGFDENGDDFISGIIPEINLAYIILDKSFNYWSIGTKSTRPMALDVGVKINSVGLVKPPSGYFRNLSCDHVLVIAGDDYLFFHEIQFKRGMSRTGNAEIGKLLVQTQCEDITYDQIKSTLNCRVFTGNKNAVVNEVKFTLESSWFNAQKTKRVFTEEKRAWYNKYIPSLLFSSKNDIIQISIDEERHLLYTLSQKDYSKTSEIAPCSVEIFYLGAFGEAFRKVNSISQAELTKEYKKNKNSIINTPLQLTGLHHISVQESDDIHFMLITSSAQRIYISLKMEEYDSEKMQQEKGVDYTAYHSEVPTGEWSVLGISNPPLPKDIAGSSGHGVSCCTQIGFDHTDLCVTDSSYYQGSLFINGLNRETEDKVLLYIHDKPAAISSKSNYRSGRGSIEQFWALEVGESKEILDIKQKPLETYVDEDILTVLGYPKTKVMKEGIKPQKKTKNNEYRLTNKNMYSDQVYLPCEEYFIMNNVEVVTMIKKRPIDELFTILYIAHKPNTYMDDEIDAFFEDNGVTESCCMLLQLICNPFEEYQLNLSKTSKERRIPKNSSAMRYGYTPKSKYEEQKGYESDDDYSKNNQESAEVSENCKPEKSLLDFAKKLFFEKSNMFINTSRLQDRHYGYNDARKYYAPYTKDREEQSAKLASCLLYLSRILQPIFKNYLVYITSLNGKSDSYPNMGISEKRVVRNKLNNLLQFIKNEESTLKSISKESKENRGYRDYEYEQKSSEFHLNYESIIFKESQHFDFLKIFIARCIISIEFIDEISKSDEDFNKAVKKLSKEEKGHLQSIQFCDLTRDVTNDKSLKAFIKKLLEVKAEGCHDLKDAKRMCDSWHSKCNAFIDKEFIDVFISEHQLSKQIESSVKNDEVIRASISSLLNNPIKFEIDKVVFMLIRLNKVREIILLLCTRFLAIQEYEKEEAKLASSRDVPIRKEFDNNREKENECIMPILEILTAIYDSYVKKFGKKSVAEEYFKGILDQQNNKEQNIYDYLRIEILEKLDAKKLIDMKSEFLKDTLTYDSEGLHNTILTWMIDKELFDDLEKVDSPYFGKFIEKVKSQNQLNTNQISLVYKYLMKTQQFELLINFFTPIIWSVTGAPDSRIKGECSINHRLLYIDISQKACDSIEAKTDSYQNLQGIKTALENNKTVLMIQSDIENFLKSSLKKLQNEHIIRQFKEGIELLNTKIFKEEELIEEVTKKLKLHDFTIRILFNLIVNGDTLSRKMTEDIKDCYCNILNYFCTSMSKSYPKCAYDRILDMAIKYYVNDIPTNNRKMPFKKCNDEVKKAFFPAEDILHYVETFNEKHFGGDIDNTEFIDMAMDRHMIQQTPYWFISILQTTNFDCLSHAITILKAHHDNVGTNTSLCYLIVGVKRYVDAIYQIEPTTVDPKERRAREEYFQYLLTLKDIVNNLMSLLNESQCMMVIDKQLEEKLFEVLDETQYKINIIKDANSSRGSKGIPAKHFDSSNKNSDRQVKEFSFKGSTSSSNAKRLTESSHQTDSMKDITEKSPKLVFPKEESKYDYDSEESFIDTSNKKDRVFESRRPRRSKEQMQQPPARSGGQGPPKLF